MDRYQRACGVFTLDLTVLAPARNRGPSYGTRSPPSNLLLSPHPSYLTLNLGLRHLQWHQQMLRDRNPPLARHRSALVESNWQRKDADATSADLIGTFQLHTRPHSALADVRIACKGFCMVEAYDLNRLGREFVDDFR